MHGKWTINFFIEPESLPLESGTLRNHGARAKKHDARTSLHRAGKEPTSPVCFVFGFGVGVGEAALMQNVGFGAGGGGLQDVALFAILLLLKVQIDSLMPRLFFVVVRSIIMIIPRMIFIPF
jgi:hypothetical protein